jgi:hypothetical protein
MVRRRANKVVLRIKQCAQDGLLLFSDHARREMNDDNFNEADVTAAIQKGDLVARQTHGERGTRYVMRGAAPDGREMEVVCRIAGSSVRIVTVYRV